MMGKFCPIQGGTRRIPRGWCCARSLIALLVLASLTVLAVPAVAAEQRFEPGDEVEVLFLRDWIPAQVLEVDRRGAVGAEFTFANASQRRIFTQNQVRMKCEVDGLGLIREWQDASGNFRIRAALIRYAGDRVTLRKIDMEEIDVPVSALCKSDNRYLAKIKKAIPGGATGSAGLATIERFDGTPSGTSPHAPPDFGPEMDDHPFGQGQSMSFGGDSESPRDRFGGGMTISLDEVDRRALAPDAVPSHLIFSQGGTGFPVSEFFARIGAVVPVGGSDGWVLASVEDGSPGSDAKPTHLIWVSLTSQKIENTQILPVNDIVLDYHSPSHRLLTCSRENSDPEDNSLILSVWEVLPTDKAAQSIVRWETRQDEHVSEPWARFVDGGLVMQRMAEKDYLAWDLARKALRYRISQETFFSPTPAFSGSRKYFALPEDKRVRIFDTVSGETVCTLPVKHGANAVAFSRDGRRLAVLEGSSMAVWDLTDAQAEPERLQAEAIGGGFDLTMAWLGDRHLMIDRGLNSMVLFGLEHQVALWSYRFSMDVEKGLNASRSRALVADHLVYSAGFRQGTQAGLAVGAVELPGSDAQAAIATLDPDSLMLIRPGSSIRIEVDAGEHNDRIRASLERRVESNGWKLDPSATNVLYAEIKRGETQQVTYDFKGKRPNATVSGTPYAHTVRIVCDEEKAWGLTVNYGVPGIVAVGKDDSVQELVNSTPKVNPEFFETLGIPERIFDPKKRNGLGASSVTNRGLVPK